MHKWFNGRLRNLSAGIVVVGAVAGGGLNVPSAMAAAGGAYLEPGQKLRATGQYIKKGDYKAIMQADGNFVLYKDGEACWASRTRNSGADYLVFQNDGNVVIKKDDGTIVWAAASNLNNPWELLVGTGANEYRGKGLGISNGSDGAVHAFGKLRSAHC